MRRLLVVAVSMVALAGCDCGPTEVADAGVDAGHDAGTGDAGHPDAGPGDAGHPDAGPVDAGPTDAGPSDAGPTDAGPTDAGPPSCSGGQNSACPLPEAQGICCNGVCVDSLTDSANCGFCATACPNAETCGNGLCVKSDGGTSPTCLGGCPAGTGCFSLPQAQFSECLPTDCSTLGNGTDCLSATGPGECCGNQCVDPRVDSHNCGLCRQVCPNEESCYNGRCSDPNHNPIFTCDGGCSTGYECHAGACLPVECSGLEQGQLDCAIPGLIGFGTCCQSSCTYVNDDPNNCGQCGNVCPAGSFCKAGGCVAPTCASVGDGTGCARDVDAGVTGECCDDACVDTLTNHDHCGQCGLSCGANATCVGGFCTANCNLQSCNSDSLCDTASGYCRLVDCTGKDGTDCMFSPGHLGGACCDGQCVNTYADPDNCGGCGVHSDGGACIAGDLFPPLKGTSCTHRVCPIDAPCTGNYCTHSSCEGGFLELCNLAVGGFGECCPPTAGSLQIACVDTQTDPNHCGFCDQVCPAGQSCVSGRCSGTAAECPSGKIGGYCNLDAGAGYLCCAGGGCINTDSDVANCGSCGHACTAGQSCVAGACH